MDYVLVSDSLLPHVASLEVAVMAGLCSDHAALHLTLAPVAATPPPVKSATAPASDVLPSAVGEPLPAGAVVSAPVESAPVPATNATAAPVASTPEPVNCPPQLPVETALVVDQPVITPEPAPAESVPTPAQTVSMPHDTTDTT